MLLVYQRHAGKRNFVIISAIIGGFGAGDREPIRADLAGREGREGGIGGQSVTGSLETWKLGDLMPVRPVT